MSITVELPPDIEEMVQGIPDLGSRVAAFLRTQVEYESWRRERYSVKARGIVERSGALAEQWKAEGRSREQLFEEFLEQHERVTREG